MFVPYVSVQLMGLWELLNCFSGGECVCVCLVYVYVYTCVPVCIVYWKIYYFPIIFLSLKDN